MSLRILHVPALVSAILLGCGYCGCADGAEDSRGSGYAAYDGPPATQGWTLWALEQMALRQNPSLVQTRAQVEAARGRMVQAGLYPNPTVGYTGQQIGSDGRAGQQGIYFEQTLVTGSKLQLSRSVSSQEVNAAAWQARAQEYRVCNGVRTEFYEILAAELELRTQGRLQRRAEEVSELTAEGVRQDKAERADLLGARLEARRLEHLAQGPRNRWLAAWRQMGAIIGNPGIVPAPLQGSLESDCPELDWETTLARILNASPELHVARSELCRARAALARQQAETVPNIHLRTGTQYDFGSEREQAEAEVGVEIALFDRNQGNLRAARAEVARAQAGVARTEMSLRHRLATTFRQYQGARNEARRLREGLLSQAWEVFDLRVEGFRKGKGAWSDIHDAQATTQELTQQYVQSLLQMRHAEAMIESLLLSDAISEPPSGSGPDTP